jgi:hypothetical protein
MARHDAVRGDEDPRGDEDDDGTDRVDGAECVDAIEGLDDAECADDDPCADCTDAADRDGVADAQAAADPGANGPDSEDDWDPEASTGSPPGDDRAGALALRDAEQAPFDAALGADATAASATAGAEERYEAWMRRFRASPWGRLDFGVAWRRWSTQPRYAPPTLHHEWWIVATWRR